MVLGGYSGNTGIEGIFTFFFNICHRDKLVVSPFGFESSTWDPSKDNFLPENYSVDDMEGKISCKVALQQYVGLSENSSNIVVSSVSCLFTKFSSSFASAFELCDMVV